MSNENVMGIEAGQVWVLRSNGDRYRVLALGRMRQSKELEWVRSVTYVSLKTGGFYTRPDTEFVVKFHPEAEVPE